MNKEIRKLYIFNLATDLDNPLLAFTHDWIKACLNEVSYIEVISTHVGRVDLPSQIRVREIGGGSFRKRILGIFRLVRILKEIILNRNDSMVFFHMTNQFAAIIGLPIRVFKIPQGLWYSHSASPISFKLAATFVNVVFSSSPNALPISNRKCKYVGHGINFSKFPQVQNRQTSSGKTFVSLGRVSPIKNLELFIEAVSKSSSKDKTVCLVGPDESNKDYKEQLIKLAEKLGVTLNFIGEVPYTEIPALLANFSICYTGNPRTTDKAALEAAAVGCFVICSEPNTQELTGMNLVWEEIGEFPSTIKDQINSILALENDFAFRKKISSWTKRQNDVNKTLSHVLSGIENA
jgi:glycosyltransferase involved in cell wall biosynthesis